MRRLGARPRLVLLLGAALAATPAAASVTVPIDVGLGPSGYWLFGPPTANRGALPHFALELNAYGVVDRQLILANLDRVPSNYRELASSMSEVRVRPWWALFIPSTLYLSPKVEVLGGAGMYGATWKPFGLGLGSSARGALMQGQRPPVRLRIDANLLLTYFFLYSDFSNLPPTHFLRPGVELALTVELWATERFGFSLGGSGQAYVPQVVGGFGFGRFEDMLTFAASAFLKVHVRIPFETEL